MGFDPKSRFRDQIESSARVYQNPLRQDPWAKSSYSAGQVRSSDSIESKRERINREVIEKFQKNHFKFSSGGITMMVHLGKGIVLVLVMPPYFLLFVAPKWAFQTVKPLALKAEDLVGQFFFKISAWTVDLYISFTNQLSRFRNRFKPIRKESSQKIKRPLDPRLVSLKISIIQTYSKILGLRHIFRSWRNQATEKVVNYVQNQKQAFFKKGREIVSKVQEKMHSTAERLRVRFEKWIAPKKEKAIRVAKAIDRGLEKSYLLIKKPIVKLAKMMALAFEPVATVVKAMSRYIPAVISPPFIWMAQKTSQVFKNGAKGLARARPIFKKGLGALASIASNAVSAVAKPLVQVGIWMAQATQKGFLKVLVKAKKTTSMIAFSLKRAISSVFDASKRQFKKFANFSKMKIYKAAKATLSLGHYLKKVPGFLWLLLKKMGYAILRFILRAYRAIRVLCIIIRYLVSQSLTQLEKSLHKTQ